MTTPQPISKRDQLIALQAEMRGAENIAIATLHEMLTSEFMQDQITAMETLLQECVPGSVAENQIKACIDVPKNVISWANTIVAQQGQPTPFPAAPMPTLPLPSA